MGGGGGNVRRLLPLNGIPPTTFCKHICIILSATKVLWSGRGFGPTALLEYEYFDSE